MSKNHKRYALKGAAYHWRVNGDMKNERNVLQRECFGTADDSFFS
jgi:hypothetical protein